VSCFPSSSSPPSSRGIDQDSTSTDSGAARNNLSPSQMEASLMTDVSAIVGETWLVVNPLQYQTNTVSTQIIIYTPGVWE